MDLAEFIAHSGLVKRSEVDRACYLAYFHLKGESRVEFTASQCATWSEHLNFPKPNVYRLTQNLRASPNTIATGRPGVFRLHREFLAEMDSAYAHLRDESQETQDNGSILPPVLYENTRGYIVSIAKQINASYEHNIFDGCAVLMRRLEEILLISAYEKLGIEASIRDINGNYAMLEVIVKNAEVNADLNLSRNSKRSIDAIRQLGNFSAHKITYLCKREYIKEVKLEFRALVEELMHKAGLKA